MEKAAEISGNKLRTKRRRGAKQPLHHGFHDNSMTV
jgi:hypothetical protein